MTDDRLRTIEARARALGWRFHNEPSGFTLTHPSDPNKVAYEIGRHHFGRWELGYTAAERLLTAYEPVTGPVVVIRRATDASGNFCNTNCDLSSRTLCLHCSGHVISGPHRPKETCPGPAPVGKEWRMVLCDAPDPGAGDKGDGE